MGSKNELKWYGLESFHSSPGSISMFQNGRTSMWREPQRGCAVLLQFSWLQSRPSWQTLMDNAEPARQHLPVSLLQLDVSLACGVSYELFHFQVSWLTWLLIAWSTGLEQSVLLWITLRSKSWGKWCFQCLLLLRPSLKPIELKYGSFTDSVDFIGLSLRPVVLA